MKTLEELGISLAPWKPVNTLFCENREVVDKDGNTVCVLDRLTEAKLRKANAQIMADAPDLYTALWEFVRFCDTHAPVLDAGLHPIIDKARAALSKAGGAE